MKRLKIGLQSGKSGASKKITRATAASVAGKLTTTERRIVQQVFIERRNMKRISPAAVQRLCDKGIIRKDRDLISGKSIYVLERGGEMVCRELQRKGEPLTPRPPRAVVKVERHEFLKKIIGDVVQPNCAICQKPIEHPVHMAEGKFLCPGLAPGEPAALCLNEVKRAGELCGGCKQKADEWRKAEAIRMTPVCPNCGGPKAVPPSSASSVDPKCYQRLTPALKHGLFVQHGEPEHAFRARYPIALKAALEYLRRKPVMQADINQQAKAVPR